MLTATAMRSTRLLRLVFRHVPSLLFQRPLLPATSLGLSVGRVGLVRLRCSAAEVGDGRGKKVSARLALTQQVMRDAEERAASAGSDPAPAPKITLDHVTVNFARSGGPGGQNVNKVNTKVDMRFNVEKAHWLGERIKERILQTEKNRINKDGATLKMLCRKYRQSLMLHHMFLHRLQKSKRGKLKKLLQPLRGTDSKRRKYFHKRRSLEGTGLAGIDCRITKLFLLFPAILI